MLSPCCAARTPVRQDLTEQGIQSCVWVFQVGIRLHPQDQYGLAFGVFIGGVGAPQRRGVQRVSLEGL